MWKRIGKYQFKGQQLLQIQCLHPVPKAGEFCHLLPFFFSFFILDEKNILIQVDFLSAVGGLGSPRPPTPIKFSCY